MRSTAIFHSIELAPLFRSAFHERDRYIYDIFNGIYRFKWVFFGAKKTSSQIGNTISNDTFIARHL